MSMRHYIRDPDYDCPPPTPDEQLRSSGRRSLFGLIAVNALAIIGIVCVWVSNAYSQTLTAPTRISPYDWACLSADGSVLSNHQRFDTAFVACYNNAQGAEIVGGRYRIARVTAPPEPCPAKPGDETRAGVCPSGTTGSWTQTLTHVAAPPPACWTPGEWLPSAAPEGACVTPPPPPPPTLPAPGGISATVSPNVASPERYNVNLSWLAVTGATGYAIERCTGATCTTNFEPIATPTNTAYTNSSVPSGLTYRYRIRGTAAAVIGAWSALRNVTTPTVTQPPPPAGTGTASLDWLPPTTNVDGSSLTDLAGFRIVYGTSQAQLTQLVQVPNASTRTHTVDGLTPGTWYFAVRAYTSVGAESANSNVGSKVVP